MANGDIATAAGLPTVPPTADIRNGYDEINLTRDEVATHMTTGTHTWEKVMGKPLTFTPAVHGHGWTEINVPGSGNLAGWIDAYVARNTSGGNSAVRYAQGPTSAAYARSVGSSYYSVYMDGGLEFGRNVSSRRYKDDIAPADIDLTAVLALEPVTFHRKSDEDPESRDLGLIAEDSVDVPFLVIYEDDRPEAVRYETVLPVVLLSVVKAQQKQIDALTRRLEILEGDN